MAEKINLTGSQEEIPENCMKLSVPLTNKEIWNQLNNFLKKIRP